MAFKYDAFNNETRLTGRIPPAGEQSEGKGNRSNKFKIFTVLNNFKKQFELTDKENLWRLRMETVKTFVIDIFNQRRELGRLSPVHDLDHVSGVATVAQCAGKVLAKHYGFKHNDVMYASRLAYIAGWFHDIVREPDETKPHGQKGAELLRRVSKNFEFLKPLDFEAVLFAVANHELNFDEADKLEAPSQLAKVLLLSVIIGDKIAEAKGPRVVERRSAFVSGERLTRGDLKNFAKLGHTLTERRMIAFIGESLIRWGYRNSVSSYPEKLRPFVASMENDMEKQFVFAIMKKFGIHSYREPGSYTLDDFIDQELVGRFPKFDKNKFSVEYINNLLCYEYEEFYHKVDVVDEVIYTNNEDFVDACYTILNFYADAGMKGNPLASLDSSILLYHNTIKKSPEAQKLVEKIIAYHSGGADYTEDFEKHLEKAFPPREAA